MSKTKNSNGLNKLEVGGLLDGLCIGHDNSCKGSSYYSGELISLPKYPLPEYSEKSLKETIAEATKQLIDEGEDPEDILEEVELAVKDHKKKDRKYGKKQKENLNLWKNLTK